MESELTDRALFLHRDSGGKHETTPGEYVRWVIRTAKELKLTFDGSPERIEKMIREGCSVAGDIYLDYGVSGNKLSRPALNALVAEALSDSNVTHIFIFGRDRLSRPDDALDGVMLEDQLRKAGKTIVYFDKTLPPLPKGKRRDIGDLIAAVVDFNQSGQFRRDLGEKMIFTQLNLAKSGFSTGGRASFGFRRWLVKTDGTKVRQLDDGEHVRMQDHHVVWLPGPQEEIDLALRIRRMLLKDRASRVAATLNAEGIPSPDAGRSRTDNGVERLVSGLWHQSMIVNIGRNPLFKAVVRYGARSMGDQVRLTPDGPRDLEEADYQPNTNKPKVILNPESSQITAPALFEPLEDPAEHERLERMLDQRAGTQRGKPRSRNPAMNPLGCRLFDMNCGSTMYRVAQRKTFRYTCGLYQQSHAQRCDHNHVDGPTAARFALSCIRQRLVSPGAREKLRERLKKLSQSNTVTDQSARVIDLKRSELNTVEEQLKTATNNLALAMTKAQYAAVAGVFDNLNEKKKQLEKELVGLQRKTKPSMSSEAEVDQVLRLVDRLAELADQPEDFGTAKEIFDLTNLRMFFRFEPQKLKKRTVNKVVGGMVVFGEAEPPVELYQGPTSSKKLKENSQKISESIQETQQNNFSSGVEDKSLRNVNRDDRI